MKFLHLLITLFVFSNSPSQADMAFAVGATGNLAKDGFVWGGSFDQDSNTRIKEALDICSGAKRPVVGGHPQKTSKTEKLCKIVLVDHDCGPWLWLGCRSKFTKRE
jgi:hypothetical protein